MSGAEVASLISAIDGRNDRDDGFFGDGIWGIIMLLIIAGLFSGNGFGWGNRGNGNIAMIVYLVKNLSREIYSILTKMYQTLVAKLKEMFLKVDMQLN